MSFITEIINDLLKCCCPFLFPQQQQRSGSNLSQPLIEMQTFPTKREKSVHSRNQSRKKTASCNDAQSANDQNTQDKLQGSSENMIQSLDPPKNKKNNFYVESAFKQSQQSNQLRQQKPLVIRRIESGKLLTQDRKSGSQSSFQTIKSTASRPISRRNFKILRHSSSFYAKHRSVDDDFYSVNHSQNSSINGQQIHRIMTFKFAQNNENTKDGIDMMNVWMKKQYEAYPSRMYKPVLSQITKMKLSTKDVFDSMVHRLEDYYTFYLEDQHFLQSSEHLESSMSRHYNAVVEPQSFNYEEINHQMICSMTKTAFTKSFDYQKSCKFMSLIIIPHCSLPPLAFIQWFNKLEVQSALQSFNRIEYIQNSQRVDDKITLQYPLVRVQQFNQKLFGKQTFLLARQIEVVKFENDEDKQTLLEICFEAIDEQNCFQRLVRVTAQGNDGSRVQIYIESSQNIAKRQTSQLLLLNKKSEVQKQVQFVYFEQRWKKFQQKLNKDHIINKRLPQVFTN